MWRKIGPKPRDQASYLMTDSVAFTLSELMKWPHSVANPTSNLTLDKHLTAPLSFMRGFGSVHCGSSTFIALFHETSA
jgi:hypothetical protein